MSIDLNKFGLSIINSTYEKWKSYKGQYDIWNYGFGVFYSPLSYNPDLMIIGYNVGGSADDFREPDSLIIPKYHEYFEYDYKLATKQIENSSYRLSLPLTSDQIIHTYIGL